MDAEKICASNNTMIREVVVIGGAGFLGRIVTRELSASGYSVCVASRQAGAPALEITGSDQKVQTLPLDVTDDVTLLSAFESADAVVNCVGLYLETRHETFQSVHVDGARQVAEQAKRAGVGKLIHISGIGADRISHSTYVSARAKGEDVVRDAFPDATILRPSAMFDADGAFFGALNGIVRLLPIIPLFGDGGTRLQPVFVDDVAKAVRKSLETERASGEVFELGGPDVFTYREILQRLAALSDRRRMYLPVPFAIWRTMATILGILPRPPITMAQVVLMESDNVVGDDVGAFVNLEITPQSAIAMGLV